MKKYSDMTNEERINYFASGRCTAGLIQQLVDGDIKKFYLPKVRGHFIKVQKAGKKLCDTPEEALQIAREFRERMRAKCC